MWEVNVHRQQMDQNCRQSQLSAQKHYGPDTVDICAVTDTGLEMILERNCLFSRSCFDQRQRRLDFISRPQLQELSMYIECFLPTILHLSMVCIAQHWYLFYTVHANVLIFTVWHFDFQVEKHCKNEKWEKDSHYLYSEITRLSHQQRGFHCFAEKWFL